MNRAIALDSAQRVLPVRTQTGGFFKRVALNRVSSYEICQLI